jgi:hypothetical protein
LILGIAGLHLVLLHTSGRRVPLGQRMGHFLKTKFQKLFVYKDLVNAILLWVY